MHTFTESLGLFKCIEIILVYETFIKMDHSKKCTLWFPCTVEVVMLIISRQQLYLIPVGGFPIEIRTKIRYQIICCYHNFTLWNYLILVLILIVNPPFVFTYKVVFSAISTTLKAKLSSRTRTLNHKSSQKHFSTAKMGRCCGRPIMVTV